MKEGLFILFMVAACTAAVFGICFGIVYVVETIDRNTDIPARQYELVDRWIDESPELGDMFTEFTWEDNKLQRWEYDAISDKRDELTETATVKKIQDKLRELLKPLIPRSER